MNERFLRFIFVGLISTIIGLGVYGLLLILGVQYVLALIITNVIIIISGFSGQEFFIYRHYTIVSTVPLRRLMEQALYITGETFIRIPLLIFFVEVLIVGPWVSQLILTVVLFILKFLIFDKYIYRGKTPPS